jgi:hypothetical protein
MPLVVAASKRILIIPLGCETMGTVKLASLLVPVLFQSVPTKV